MSEEIVPGRGQAMWMHSTESGPISAGSNPGTISENIYKVNIFFRQLYALKLGLTAISTITRIILLLVLLPVKESMLMLAVGENDFVKGELTFSLQDPCPHRQAKGSGNFGLAEKGIRVVQGSVGPQSEVQPGGRREQKLQ